MKLLNFKLPYQLIHGRKFSVASSRLKYFYQRPFNRSLLGNLNIKKNELSEYAWYKQWIEDENLDVELAKNFKYRKFYEMGDKHRAKDILIWQYHDYVKNAKFYFNKKYNLGGRLNHLNAKDVIFPDYCDIVIIGAGLAGTSIAYHIKRIVGDGVHVVIVDKDFTFAESATVNLGGVVKQQFSTAENFQLSQYAIQFLDNAVEELSFDDYLPRIGLNYAGYMTLASEDDASQLNENYLVQRNLGASLRLMRPEGLKQQYPWINTDGIELAVLGIGQEGWCDPWALLAAMHRKLGGQGVDYVCGEVIDCKASIHPDLAISRGHPGDMADITHLVVKLADGTHRAIQCNKAILAAGWRSGELAKIFDIGLGYDAWHRPLPISKRKRYLYYLHVADGPGLNSPFVMDTSRIFFRREGLADTYLCGFSIDPSEDPNAHNNKTDDEYFKSEILPVLTHRVSAFKDSKIIRSAASFHDYNEFDQTPVIGFHPGAINIFIATGFGENSVNALGVGNYFMELIMDRKLTIDLMKCNFQRLCREEKFIDGGVAYLE